MVQKKAEFVRKRGRKRKTCPTGIADSENRACLKEKTTLTLSKGNRKDFLERGQWKDNYGAVRQKRLYTYKGQRGKRKCYFGKCRTVDHNSK